MEKGKGTGKHARQPEGPTGRREKPPQVRRRGSEGRVIQENHFRSSSCDIAVVSGVKTATDGFAPNRFDSRFKK